ncbi:methyltransferase domain-containing protein [Campylobacter upsaliensis]|uniref:SAM-dependent methyltransferase n=1 Tax=Campylobacter upsaliensis TaxID=28080 RepID=A0A448KPW7_CAMUP|nr:class I SAM-dependent methyltransferase [Campylobacter upsaliensis]EAH9284938.1 class I SAM-dependent methyltransferase [Campylobacter upsaliensis]EAK0456941.1 class I SAM-dependent methyltransferase [Campylobacter upsaliensis]ECL5232490.1 class I SAM-dependent methyltransferase [Campylobacter upsaliensis]EDP6887084.1 methyltransferase domain-containing protein [Campylobacter upsaliensis]EGK8070242.1 class I SAM-dependent methyltransferase [Campylobacter upsaliensis]
MNLWDKKAKTYARFSPTLNEIQKQSFEEFQKLGLDFKDKSVIDIGCGTGVWTLHLAFLAKEILALDNSKAMLEILQEDASKLGLSNIKSVNLSFEDFMRENANLRFDIAFLSMSPALQNDYKHFLNLAQKKIYLAWADLRKSDFLDPIFKHFNTEFKGFYKEDFESFLLENDIDFHKVIFEERRVVKRTREEAIENALWHLHMNGINAKKNELESLILGDVREKIVAKIKLIIVG